MSSGTAVASGVAPSSSSGNGMSSGIGVAGPSAMAAPAPVAPIIEPPACFGLVEPGIYRCSAASLTQGLPANARQSTASKFGGQSSGTSASNGGHATPIQHTTSHNTSSLTPTETFLSSLQLKTVLLLAPERRPLPLTSWCRSNNVDLIHLGLGALAENSERPVGRHEPEEVGGVRSVIPSMVSQRCLELYGSPSDTGILSLERLVKDSLEILLHRYKLPCLVCDTSGVSETGVVIGCLRRMQRRSFASIRYEYRAFAANRARSSHERFIEIFDPDLISLPSSEMLPSWFAQQQTDDEAEEARILAGL